MREVSLDSVELMLLIKDEDVIVKTKDKFVVLINQTIVEVEQVLVHNFRVVKYHYKRRMIDDFSEADIDLISINVILNYIHMYNSWNSIYKKRKKSNLIFHEEDFKGSWTLDYIIFYCREKYSNSWIEKCSILLDMPEAQLLNYFNERQKFYQK